MPQSQTSGSIPSLEKLHDHKEKFNRDYPRDKGEKQDLCGPENLKWLCESMRPSLGTSMIVFAVPLLLPGITLTAVGYGEDSSFARHGALHIIGLVLLCLSGLLLLTGTVLNIRFHDKVSPDDLSTHSVSTHETKDEHREQSGDITVVSMDGKEGSPPTPSVLASFMVDAGHSSVRHTNAQHVTFGGSKVGARAEFHSGDTPGEHPWTPGRDFQPSSILSSPKNFSKVPLFDYQHTPSGSQHDTMRSDTAQAVRSSSGQEEILYQERPREDSTKTPQRKIEGKRTSERDTVREEGSHHFTSPALPGITAKRSDKSSVTLAVSSPTEDAAIEKDSSHDTENTQSSRKKKRRKKKKRAEQALDETQETGDLDSDFLGPKFSNPDHSGFLSLDKNPSRASQIHSIAEETESALRTPSRQYQMDTLSLPKTVYRKSNGPSAEEENREGRKSLSSASAAEEEEDEEKGGGGGHVRKLPKLRTQAKLKSGVPPVPPPTYDSLADSSATGIKANISGSLGAVTQVYTIDASHSRIDKS